MLRAILEMFTTEEKVASMLSHPIIEFIFIVLFGLFVVTLLVHIALYMRLQRVRQHIKTTNDLTIEPVNSIREQFISKQETDTVNIDTFVQERFSNWRVLNMPIINLIKLTKMTVSVFILLGVLGTFIGLTISLGSMSMSSDQLVDNIAVVLSGIDVAFYTSIIGMGFSLFMTVLLKFMNTEYMLTDIMLMTETKLAEKNKHGLPKLIEVSERINESIGNLQITHEKSLAGIIEAFSGFKHYTDGLIQAAKDLASFNEGLSKNLHQFQTLFTEMKTVTDGFEQSTRALNDNFAKLFTFIESAEQNQERSLTLFEQTYENISAANEDQTESIKQFTSTISTLKTFSENIITEQHEIKQTMSNINHESSKFVERLGKHNETFAQIFGENLSAQIAGMSRNVRDLASQFDQVGETFVKLPSSLDAINETQSEYRYLLSERFHDLEQFNDSFREHLRNHMQETRTFETNLRDAMNSFEQIGVKNNELIHELNRTATELTRGHQSREHQVESMVNLLKDTLANYVGNVEMTLSEKLENIAREISESMRALGSDLSREVYEIRHTAENIQQVQIQGMQQMYEGVGRELQRMLQEVARELQEANRTAQSSSRRTIPANNELGWYDHDR